MNNMPPNDVYLIMRDWSLYESLFVYALLMTLLLCIVVISICDVIEPPRNKYRELMGMQVAGYISEWNKIHPDSQIELREPK